MTRASRIARARAAIRRGLARVKQIGGYNRRRRALIKRLLAEESSLEHPSVMFDDVDLAQIPASAQMVGGYVGGSWPTYAQLAERFPHAVHVSIAVNAGEGAEVLDIETGDATPAQAPAWVRAMQGHGVKRPGLYFAVSQAPAVLAALAAAGIHRNEVRLWTAHWTFEPHLCGPHTCGALSGTTADVTQWTDTALGRSLDVSRVGKGFFG